MIYVDDMRLPTTVGRFRARWSHLMSDSADLVELHQFAEVIGIRRAWFQDHQVMPHYDVTDSKRAAALAAGAQGVEYPMGTADVMERRRAALAEAADLRKVAEQRPPMVCTGLSVGVLLVRDGRLLLIERRRGTPGWAPPAGHVEPDELGTDAAEREVGEEVGLSLRDLRCVLVWPRMVDRCRHGTERHDWTVYEAVPVGEPLRSESETRGLWWVSAAELTELAELTRAQLAAGMSAENRRRDPGLEPIWLDLLGSNARHAGTGVLAFEGGP